MRLRLTLIGLDRSLQFAVLRHHRQHLADRLAHVGGAQSLVGEAPLMRLDAFQREETFQFASDNQSGAGDTGGDSRHRKRAEHGAAGEGIRGPEPGIDAEPADESNADAPETEPYPGIAPARRGNSARA